MGDDNVGTCTCGNFLNFIGVNHSTDLFNFKCENRDCGIYGSWCRHKDDYKHARNDLVEKNIFGSNNIIDDVVNDKLLCAQLCIENLDHDQMVGVGKSLTLLFAQDAIKDEYKLQLINKFGPIK